jgi:hypothetical protein
MPTSAVSSSTGVTVNEVKIKKRATRCNDRRVVVADGPKLRRERQFGRFQGGFGTLRSLYVVMFNDMPCQSDQYRHLPHSNATRYQVARERTSRPCGRGRKGAYSQSDEAGTIGQTPAPDGALGQPSSIFREQPAHHPENLGGIRPDDRDCGLPGSTRHWMSCKRMGGRVRPTWCLDAVRPQNAERRLAGPATTAFPTSGHWTVVSLSCSNFLVDFILAHHQPNLMEILYGHRRKDRFCPTVDTPRNWL